MTIESRLTDPIYEDERAAGFVRCDDEWIAIKETLSAEYMVKKNKALDRKVYVVPREIDLEIARLKLASMDVHIDLLTAQQESYLASWRHGT